MKTKCRMIEKTLARYLNTKQANAYRKEEVEGEEKEGNENKRANLKNFLKHIFINTDIKISYQNDLLTYIISKEGKSWAC